METVPHGISTSSILRFVDIASDALGAAREEIDALNVYPVPDGDTGTNMFLTVAAARDALREAVAARARPGPGRRAGDPVPRRAARRPRQLRRHPEPDARGVRRAPAAGVRRRAQRPHRRRGDAAGDRRELRGGRPARRGHHPHRRPGRLRRRDARAPTATAPAPGTSSPRRRPPPGRPCSTPPSSSSSSPTPAWSTPAAVGCAWSSTPPRRCPPADAPSPASLTGHHRIPVPHPIPGDHLTEDGPAYEVMYLLDAEDDAIAPLRTLLDTLGDSLVVVGGGGLWNVHVHVDDVGAAIEAGIDAGRPHRVRVTHFAEQVADGPSRPRHPPACRRRRRGGPRPGRPLRGGRRRGRPRRSGSSALDRAAPRGHPLLRGDRGRAAAQRRRLGAGRRDRGPHRRAGGRPAGSR